MSIICHKRLILRNTPDLYCVVEQLARIMLGSVGIWTLHRGSPCRHFVWPYWTTWASQCWRGQRSLNWFSGCRWTGSSASQAKQLSSSTTQSLTVGDRHRTFQSSVVVTEICDFSSFPCSAKSAVPWRRIRGEWKLWPDLGCCVSEWGHQL